MREANQLVLQFLHRHEVVRTWEMARSPPLTR